MIMKNNRNKCKINLKFQIYKEYNNNNYSNYKHKKYSRTKKISNKFNKIKIRQSNRI